MWILPTILSIIAIILFIILLALKRKRHSHETKQSKEAFNKIKGKDKKVESPRESLEHLNKLSKDFLRNYLKLKSELTYSEIAEILRQKKDYVLADFCDRLDSYLYSGKEIKKEEVLAMINQFIILSKTKARS
jgi:uncharacterized protein YeeX (DUF496 family)